MLFGGSSAEYVECNLEPFVNLSMYFVVFGAELFWCDAFFKSFCFGGCAIFVGSTDVECRSTASFVVPSMCQSRSRKVEGKSVP